MNPLASFVLACALAVFGCTRGDAAKTGPGSATCKGRVAGVVSYMKRFEHANVLATEIPVPPDETKSPKALAYDAKRRLVECDAKGCRTDGSAWPFGKKLATGLRARLTRGGKSCGPVYLALEETMPAARYASVLQAVKGCGAFALTRSSLKKLPVVEPSPDAVDRLKAVAAAKTEQRRSEATRSLVRSVLKPHAKACGKTQEFLTAVARTKGYPKFQRVMTGLESRAKELAPCVCALSGQDDKVLFQVAGFDRLGGNLFVYSATRIPETAVPKSARFKSWYDFVHAL